MVREMNRLCMLVDPPRHARGDCRRALAEEYRRDELDPGT